MCEPQRRILFYYDNFCGESSRGGTEVATARIAKALKDTGQWGVFHAHLSGNPSSSTLYTSTARLPKWSFVKNLADFIIKNDIDVVVNMGRFFRHEKLKKAIDRSGKDTKLLFMHHFAPGSEKKKSTYSSALHLLRLNPYNPLYWLRIIFYPLIKLPRTLRWKQIYRKVYEKSDGVVLLSDGYQTDYMQVAGLNSCDKFFAIPNIFEKTEQKIVSEKEKRVLILSRMDEIQKRISLALLIWKKIEERGDLNDWHLDIVGSGHDIKGIKRFASGLKLKNVTFHGWQPAEEFLEHSAILMMTSDYEGLSLSMIEAQSHGVIPIAFDSYASLKDILKDNKTGVIIDRFGDIDTFSSELAALMTDDDKRVRISENAKQNSGNFSPKNVVIKWIEMLDKVTNKT